MGSLPSKTPPPQQQRDQQKEQQQQKWSSNSNNNSSNNNNGDKEDHENDNFVDFEERIKIIKQRQQGQKQEIKSEIFLGREENENNINNNKEKKMETIEVDEDRRKALEKYGVLIPPAFGVAGIPNQKGTGIPLQLPWLQQLSSSSNKTTTQTSSNCPISYYDYLVQTDLSQCIINDYICTGGGNSVSIAVHPATNTSVRCSTSTTTLPTTTTATTHGTTTIANSQLIIERRFLSDPYLYPKGRGMIQLHADAVGNVGGSGGMNTSVNNGTSNNADATEPTLRGSIQLTKDMSLFGSMNTSGTGWIGSYLDYTLPTFFVIDNNSNNLTPTMKRTTPTAKTSTVVEEQLQTQGQQPLQLQSRDEALDDRNRSNVNVKVGVWVPVNTPPSTSTDISSKSTTSPTSFVLKAKDVLLHPKEDVYGYAAINMLGGIAAIDTSIHRRRTNHNNANNTNITYNGGDDEWYLGSTIRKYISVNVNDVDQPPFQITYEEEQQQRQQQNEYDVRMDDNGNSSPSSISCTSSTSITRRQLSVSQVFTFDRIQFNPIDNRAPRVRNTLAWTARLEQQQQQRQPELNHNKNGKSYTTFSNNNSASSNSDQNIDKKKKYTTTAPPTTTAAMMSLGVAWQVNRNIAVKAIVQPQNGALTSAIILKRWKQPRITCSIVHVWKNNHYNNNTDNYSSTGCSTTPTTTSSSSSSVLLKFLPHLANWGISIELEAGDYSKHNKHKNSYNNNSNNPNERDKDIFNQDYVQDNYYYDNHYNDCPPTKLVLPPAIEYELYQRKKQKLLLQKSSLSSSTKSKR